MSKTFKFKGSAQPLGPRWKEGFNKAYDLRLEGKDPFKYVPDWAARNGQYGNGFAEGSLSGRSKYHRLLSLDQIPSNRLSTNIKFRLN
jgi:hypothetical protein